MSKYLLPSSIVVLLFFHGLMIYKYKSLDNSYLEFKRNAYIDGFRSETFTNTNRVIVDGDDVIGNIINGYAESINNSDANIPKDGLGLILFFRSNDCTSCIVQTWDLIEQFYEDSLISSAPVYLYEKNNDINIDQILEYNNVEIEYFATDFMNDLLSIDVNITPLLVIFDYGDNKVVDSYQPEPDNLLTREAFIERWKNITSIKDIKPRK